jgi:hypothetical protein
MRPRQPKYHSYEQWRQNLLDETSRFIEWGLQNPERIEWIPTHPVGRGGFPERLKNVFWALVIHNSHLPD